MPDTTIDPLLRRMETPLRARLYPLGFPLDVESNDARVIDAAYSSFGIFTDLQREGARPLRLRVVCVPESTEGEPWPAHSFRAYRDLFTIVIGPDNFLVSDLERGEANGFFSTALLDNRDYFCSIFLEGFTYMALTRHWVAPFHAACVVRDGRGICLAGTSQSGKSTLAYGCVKAGYKLLSDNAVYMMNAEGAAGLAGNPSRLTLRASARELFPELRDAAISYRDNGDAIVAVSTQRMFPEQLATYAEPGPIVFLERGPGAATLEDVEPETARRRLFLDRNLNVDEPHVMETTERVLQRAVRNGAYRMKYSTLDQALECLDQIRMGR